MRHKINQVHHKKDQLCPERNHLCPHLVTKFNQRDTFNQGNKKLEMNTGMKESACAWDGCTNLMYSTAPYVICPQGWPHTYACVGLCASYFADTSD